MSSVCFSVAGTPVNMPRQHVRHLPVYARMLEQYEAGDLVDDAGEAVFVPSGISPRAFRLTAQLAGLCEKHGVEPAPFPGTREHRPYALDRPAGFSSSYHHWYDQAVPFGSAPAYMGVDGPPPISAGDAGLPSAAAVRQWYEKGRNYPFGDDWLEVWDQLTPGVVAEIARFAHFADNATLSRFVLHWVAHQLETVPDAAAAARLLTGPPRDMDVEDDGAPAISN